jgi:ABC-2 type transport system permease protein
MKWHRIKALLIRHLYLYKRSFPRWMDIFYWPILELLLWGFLSLYLAKSNLGGVNAITLLLGAVIFWDLMSQSQRVVSIAFLEDVWERNFLNLFVTPLKKSEFVASAFILGIIRVAIVGIVMTVLAFLFYHFSIFTFGFTLIPFILSLLLFGWTLGLFTVAIILRYGTSAQVLAFGFIVLIQPFSAVFYPVSVLPHSVQYIAYAIPSTYIFEGMRGVITSQTFSWSLFSISILLNLVYFVLCGWYFSRMFANVKRRGSLHKLND